MGLDPNLSRSGRPRRQATPRALFELHGICAHLLFGARVICGRSHRRIVVDDRDPEWSYAALRGADIEPALAEALSEVDGKSWSAVATGFPCEPPGLRTELTSRGWRQRFRHDYLLSARMKAAPEQSSSIAVRELAGAADVDGYLRVFAEAHTSEPRWVEALEARLLFGGRPDGVDVRHLVACDGGEVIGCASLVAVDGVAGFYNLAVLPAWRGMGVGLALVSRRERLAATLACRAFFLLAAEPWIAAWHQRRGYRLALDIRGWTPLDENRDPHPPGPAR